MRSTLLLPVLAAAAVTFSPLLAQAGDFTLNASWNRMEAHLEAETNTISGADLQCRLLEYEGADENTLTMTETDCVSGTVYAPVADHWQFWEAVDRENAEAFTMDPAEYARAELWDGTLGVDGAITCYSYASSNDVWVSEPHPYTPIFSGPAPDTQAVATTSVNYEFTRSATFNTTQGSETLEPVMHFDWLYEQSIVSSGLVKIDVTMTIGTDHEITMKEKWVGSEKYVEITANYMGAYAWSKLSSTPIIGPNSVIAGTIDINAGEYPVVVNDGDVISVTCVEAFCCQDALEHSFAEMGVQETISGYVPASGLELRVGFGSCPCSGGGDPAGGGEDPGGEDPPGDDPTGGT